MNADMNAEINLSQLAAFLDSDGRITQLPKKTEKKLQIYAYLATKFEPDRIYREKEVNAIIDQWHTFGDYFILRRMLIEYGFLARKRDGSEYWVVKKEEASNERENG